MGRSRGSVVMEDRPGDRKMQLTEQQWDKLRRQLVQYVRASDGEFDYEFRCDNLTELWRARTLAVKEAGTVEWIKAEVRPGDVFCDIGANVGLYTLMAAKRVGPRGLVYAFEPHVGNVYSLLHNVSRNGFSKNVRVISAALHESEGFFDFHYQQAEPGSSMSQLADTRDAAGQEFQPAFTEYKYATTLDRLVQRGELRAPDLIKIDVDGNELLIVRGMRNLLSGPRPPRALQIEINTRYKADLFALLSECGYTSVVRHDTQSGKAAIAAGKDPEAIGYNAIFRRAA